MDPDNAQLEGIVASVRNGDREAFTELVLACERDLRLWLTARAPHSVDVDDVAHQIFIAAFEHLDRYRPVGSVQVWSTGIARNLLRHQLRGSQGADIGPAPGWLRDLRIVAGSD